MDLYLITAIEAALAAGKEILKIYDDPNSDFEIERKADNSPLTIADRASNNVITGFLQHTPYPVLSEEGRTIDYTERKEWKTLWVVDPLDGTKEFIRKNGEFTVNIALVTDGVPVMGVIYVPVKNELYWGAAGLGAFKICPECGNESRTLPEWTRAAMRLPQVVSGRPFTVVASRSHLSLETAQLVEKYKEYYPDMEMVSVGSSIKICLVAEGAADLYPRFAPTMEWDTAAGHAIARAAGFEIYQTDRKTPLAYNKENLLNPWFIVEKAN